LEERSWKRMQNCTIYIYIILGYDQYSDSKLEHKFRVRKTEALMFASPGQNCMQLGGVCVWICSVSPNSVPSRFQFKTALQPGHPGQLIIVAIDHMHDQDRFSDLLPNERTSSGWYTMYCTGMELICILQMRPAYCVNLTVKMDIDHMECNYWVYYYLQLVHT
jgi:hypothetical protein